MSMRLAIAGVLTFAATACASVAANRPHRVPDVAGASASAEIRGTAAAANAVPHAEQLAVIREVVRGFFRPTGGQARWIDPQPLAHERTRLADSLARPNEDWADEIVHAIDLRNVCALGDIGPCDGKPGGALRFSAPYATTGDTVVIFARYAPVENGTPSSTGGGSDIELRLVPEGAGWRIASKNPALVNPRY